MSRNELLNRISNRVGSRKLVWFGTRGEDVQALLDLPQFREVYSLIAPLKALSLEVEECLELVTRIRVDLDTYNLDADVSRESRKLRKKLYKSLGTPSVLVPYRPLAFLSAVQYPRRGYVEYLGLFHERQAPFEHKAWVETELRELGIPIIPWKYYMDDDRRRVQELLQGCGRLVVRTNRSDGGTGVFPISTLDELRATWSRLADGFLAVSRELRPHVPLNTSGCVFMDGSVTLHPPSLQLLGLCGCTNRPYGYCGNDFGAVKAINRVHIEDLDRLARRAGKWLHSCGYLGAFGVDAMVYEGRVLLVEVNPRFQGSSAMSAALDAELERPDIFLCHIAAHLGIAVNAEETLEDLVGNQSMRAQVICHNCSSFNLTRIRDLRPGKHWSVQLLPDLGVSIEPEAILARCIFERDVTTDGFQVQEDLLAGVLSEISSLFEPPDAPERGDLQTVTARAQEWIGSEGGERQVVGFQQEQK